MQRRFLRLGAALLFAAGAVTADPASVDLNLEGRVALRAAVEKVYQDHRIDHGPWVLNHDVLNMIRTRVIYSLAECRILKDRWNDPVTQADLDAEWDRVLRDTNDPAMLNDLYRALEYNPILIREIVLRPLVAERRFLRHFSADAEIHAARRHLLHTLMARADSVDPEFLAKLYGVEYFRDNVVLVEPEVLPYDTDSDAITLPPTAFYSFFSGLPGDDRVWSASEYRDSFMLRRVLRRGTSSAEMETIQVSKIHPRPWLDRQIQAMKPGDLLRDLPEKASRIVSQVPPSIFESYDCEPDQWHAMSIDGAPEGRDRHTIVWTGAEMIVWGGMTYRYEYSGGRYNPALDAWSPTSEENVPTARYYHRAFWTGSRMLVWGGRGYASNIESTFKQSGGLYDPVSDTWTFTSVEDAPDARAAFFAVWTGTKMIVWGGWNGADYFETGGIYDPVEDTWSSVLDTTAPPGRNGDMAVWTGTEMVVWGGYGEGLYQYTGGRYDPANNSWSAISVDNTPSPRTSIGAFLTGNGVLIWGGWDGTFSQTGALYDLRTDTWSEISTEGAPTARDVHTACYTGRELFVWGGWGWVDASDNPDDDFLDTGGLYRPGLDTWTPTSMNGMPTARYWARCVWTGSRILLWGGFPHTTDGAAYTPSCYTNQKEFVDPVAGR
ncbi:MAG TPA: hypothetical protein PK014_06985 [Thermoanaerobaculia bacterium]|nr:hypothetical protein [Thermoanaerobaculia bacterium]HUM29815.1 hypothetical protein [Thermoanaerobaculia bacterium]HXK68090.1 hypothetical protein [Thermoanaerobaculia bacterium]